MSDEPSPDRPDFSVIDLSLSFAPAWAKETDPAKEAVRLAAKHGDAEERGERGRYPAKKMRGGRDERTTRPEKPSLRREGDDRPRGKKGREREERRPEPRAAVPELTGWNAHFVPDRRGVEGLAKQIKASAKAYSLFDLARLVLEKSERYAVELKRASDEASGLFQVKADGTLWLGEGEAVAHVLRGQFDRFYRREAVAVEPPKGAFPFVAVCGMSGEILGPPNYHDYQTKLRELHATRFANMPFEAFKARIRMERDEATIEKWREAQSTRDVYYPIEEAAPSAERVEDAAGSESPESAAIEPGEKNVEPEVAETPAAEMEAIEEKPGALKTLADVERHFRESHLGSAVVKIRDRVLAPGPVAMNDSAPGVLARTRGAWQELERFPLPLAHSLGQQLASRGVQIFKAHENITYAGVARPRFLDIEAMPVSDALQAMIRCLTENASLTRAEQWKALVALRSEESAEQAVAADLSWLVREGYVTDYACGCLEVTKRPEPRTAG